jgi:hypothetical protein
MKRNFHTKHKEHGGTYLVGPLQVLGLMPVDHIVRTAEPAVVIAVLHACSNEPQRGGPCQITATL